ncbi:hypothetical protein AB5I41_19165 [Sphingomonas sp. MMS24-JH45]
MRRYGAALEGKWLGLPPRPGLWRHRRRVDERPPQTAGRRANRNAADADWLARGARMFRLPGIDGPGRSPLERVASGEAHRTAQEGQVFSRVHVADIASGVVAGSRRRRGRTTSPV